MLGIDAYLFGYRLVRAEPGGEARLATALLRLGIVGEGIGEGEFLIRSADFRAFRAYAGGRVRYTASPIMGLPAAILSLRNKIPQLVCVILSAFLVIFLSHLVWDVRVEGAENIPIGDIEEKISSAGLRIGSLWDSVDSEEVETSLLASAPEISWVQINRVGTVAYVIVRERAPTSEPNISPFSCSNIVAEFDGVIEEVTVTRGVALVKTGDVVRAGDILISGVVETEGGTYFTAAEGSVRAHVAGQASAVAERYETKAEREYLGVDSLALSIFGVNINILKKYGNSHEHCVIIETEEEYLRLFGKRLPVAVLRAHRYHITERELRHADAELPKLAGERLDELLVSELAEADLISLKSSGEYTDKGYSLVVDYVISRDIGEEKEVILGG